jgi:hypothetical protein
MNNKPYIIDFPKIGNPEPGYISVAEAQKNIPFDIKRVYWTYFTPNEVKRGGHSHKKLNQFIFAVSGIITFKIEDALGNKEQFILDNPSKGLFIPEKIWRDIEFSHNAVLLCLASEVYDEKDYIRDYNEFKSLAL